MASLSVLAGKDELHEYGVHSQEGKLPLQRTIFAWLPSHRRPSERRKMMNICECKGEIWSLKAQA